MTIFLDMDGVLADFDKSARRILNTENSYEYEFKHGTDEFWRRLNGNAHFFEDLTPMPDMDYLLNALEGHDVKVLTALPRSDADRVARQKTNWIHEWVGEYEVICTRTHDKFQYSGVGHVLIDDRTVNAQRWREKGGNFIWHTSAYHTVDILKDMRILLI